MSDEVRVGDYVFSTLCGWEQGYIVKIHPPATKFKVVVYEVERPDGKRYRITDDFAEVYRWPEEEDQMPRERAQREAS